MGGETRGEGKGQSVPELQAHRQPNNSKGEAGGRSVRASGLVEQHYWQQLGVQDLRRIGREHAEGKRN